MMTITWGCAKTKAKYLPHDMAYPFLYAIDRDALSDADAEILKKICPPGMIDLDMEEKEIEVEVGSIIIATGWRPYDATNSITWVSVFIKMLLPT